MADGLRVCDFGVRTQEAIQRRSKEAVRLIHERVTDPIEFASHEYQAIQDALRQSASCARIQIGGTLTNYGYLTYEFDSTLPMENLLRFCTV
jgi:hypothetical protein